MGSTKFHFLITITFSAGLSTMLKLFLFMSLLCSPAFCSKCSVDKEVRFILKNMNPTSVEREVDCVVGIGPCDNLGVRLKAEAPSAVRQGRCGKMLLRTNSGSSSGEQNEEELFKPVEKSGKSVWLIFCRKPFSLFSPDNKEWMCLFLDLAYV